jgi:hypothetical protein
MADKAKEKSSIEKMAEDLANAKQEIRWLSLTNFILLILAISTMVGFGGAGVGVRDDAVLAELQSLHKALVIQYKEDHLYLTYDDLSSGRYKVVHVVNGADGTALLQIPGPRGYGERVVRKIPVELLVEGKEFDINGTFSPKLRDLPQ